MGVLWGAYAHKRPLPKQPSPKPAPAPPHVRVELEAFEVYTDGAKALVPAHVTTGGVGDKPVAESDQGATSTDPKKPLLISRVSGSKLWLIFQWQGHIERRLINPWPLSSIPYIVEFDLGRPNPRTVRHRAAH